MRTDWRSVSEGRGRRRDLLQLVQEVSGLMPSEMNRLQQLEDENTKLKQIVADPSLDRAMLQDVLSKKL